MGGTVVVDEVALLYGGPRDGEEWRLRDSRGGRLLVPCPLDIGSFDTSPYPTEVLPVGLYEARLNEFGHFSRDDTGRLTFDWKGWR